MSGGERAKAALEEVCRRYWVPVFQTICQRNYPDAEAQDLTQEFLVKLTDSSLWRRADPNRGRFRSFLLGALARFLREIEMRRRAQKRGGDVAHVNAHDEELAGNLPDAALTEEIVRTFDRNWALGIMSRALARTQRRVRSAATPFPRPKARPRRRSCRHNRCGQGEGSFPSACPVLPRP